MTLNGIDIYDGQYPIDISKLDSRLDFVIVKATQGNWTQEHWRQHVKSVLDAGKLLGLYHFPEIDKGAKAEARHFVSVVKDYIGKAVLCLDWENNEVTGQRNLDAGPKYAKAWLDEVYRLTGVRPLIYTGYNVTNDYDWSAVAKHYKLWGAQYLYRYYNHPTTGFIFPELRSGWGAWGKPTIYQYNSTSYLRGYDDNLDMDIYYGDKRSWRALAAVTHDKDKSNIEVINMALPNEVAAAIHWRMVSDDRFGYSWEERWGAYPETWEVLGRTIEINVGDYDCSSSAITAWRLALAGTGYEGPLYDATYTKNMRAAFLATGLFEVWDTDTTTAWLGDVYLNDDEHAAIAQYDGGDDLLSEFCWGDNGAYGNQRGDQSGAEATVNWFYDRPWYCTLHYIGGDIYGGDSPQPAPSPTPTPTPSGGSEWQGDMIGREDTTGTDDDYAGVMGKAILYLAAEGIGEYQVHPRGRDWLPTVDHYDLSDEEWGMAGDGTPIDAVRIFDDSVWYQTHNKGGEWNAPMRGTYCTGGSGDDYAGEYGVEQDAIRIWREGGSQPRYNVFS